MNLEKYISNLLQHHDCVIVPELGAFIAQKISAVYQKENSTFFPPQKQVSFNPSLIKNDGLLIQEVSQKENLSFEKAKDEVETVVQFWKNHLVNNSSLNLQGLGTLTKDESNLLNFQPQHSNLLLESFGLESIKANLILTETSETESASAIWWKAAAVIPILLGGFLYFGKPQPVTDFVNQQWSGFVSPVIHPETKAIKVVKSPIEKIEAKAETAREEIIEASIIHPHQVIAGSFRKMEEANEMVKKLQEKGLAQAKFTQKKGSYYYVALDTFKTEEEAQNYRRTISNDFPEAWILSLKK